MVSCSAALLPLLLMPPAFMMTPTPYTTPFNLVGPCYQHTDASVPALTAPLLIAAYGPNGYAVEYTHNDTHTKRHPS